jgi:hypothetical protein
MSAFGFLAATTAFDTQADITYFDAVLEDHPVAYYVLDDSSGTTARNAVSNGDASYSGNYTLGADGAIALAPEQTAVLLDGNSGALETPLTLSSGEAFSVSFWVRPATFKEGCLIQQLGNGPTWLGLEADNSLFTFISGSKHKFGAVLQPDRWTHLVLVYEGPGGNFLLYRDGELAASHTLTPEFHTTEIVLGRHKENPDLFFSGALNHVSFYSYALQPGRISKYHFIGAQVLSSPEPPDPVSFVLDPTHLLADDDGPGTEEQPFATVARGLAEAGPNVTLRVAAGHYIEPFALPAGGTENAPFTLEAFGDGQVVVDAPVPRQIFSANSTPLAHVRVRNFSFVGSIQGHWAAAIDAGPGWILEDITVHDAFVGIVLNPVTDSNGLTLERVVVEDCVGPGLLVRGGFVFGAPTVNGILIRNTTFRRCNLGGMGNGSFGGGAVIYGGRDLQVSKSRFYDNQGPGLWIADGSLGFEVTDNLFFGNYGPKGERWLGAGLQVSNSRGIDSDSPALIQGNGFRANTGYGLVLAESANLAIQQNTFLQGPGALVFRNYRLFSAGRDSMDVAPNDALRNIVVTGNAIQDWSSAAIATWPRSLIRLGHLQNNGIKIDGNTYDPKRNHRLFVLHDDILEAPPEYAPFEMVSVSCFSSETGYEREGTIEEVVSPEEFDWE